MSLSLVGIHWSLDVVTVESDVILFPKKLYEVSDESVTAVDDFRWFDN